MNSAGESQVDPATRKNGKRIRPVWRLVRMLWGFTLKSTGAYLTFSFARGILPLLQLYLVKLLVDAVAEALSGAQPEVYLPQIVGLVAIAGITYWLHSLSTTADAWLQQKVGLSLTDHLFDIIHEKSVTAGLAYYENSEFRDSLHRAQQEALYRPARIIADLGALTRNTVSVIGVVVLMITVHWLIGLVLILAALPNVYVRLIHARRLYHWQRSRTEQERLARYSNFLLTSTIYAKELLLYGLAGLFIPRFRKQRKALREEKLELVARRSRMELIAKTFSVIVIFAAIGFAAMRAVAGAVTLGSLVLVIQGIQRGTSMTQQILGSVAGLYENNLFLHNLFEFLDRKPQLVDPESPKVAPSKLQNEIRFEKVSFRYPNRETNALHDLDFTLHAGEILAITGPNGSGKTTLVKLLTRLYDPTEGRILFDGTDLRDLNQSELRRSFSLILQDFNRYHTTARENIAYGRGTDVSTQDQIETAARQAGANIIIDSLPHGYDSMLGTWFADSVDLSEGQWQKIALARALVRPASVFVFDEPASALDAESERELVDSLRDVLNGRTAILISHRMSTLRVADRVLVLKDGRVDRLTTTDELQPNELTD